MRWFLLLVLLLPGCQTIGGVEAGSFRAGFASSIADPRISEKSLTMTNEQFSLFVEKKAMSEQAEEVCKVVAPELVKLGKIAVMAGAASEGVCAIGDVLGIGKDDAEEVVEDIVEGAVTEGPLQ